jgi:hypothetical protein
MSTLGTIDSQISELQNQIAQLQARIRKLHTQRNALTSPLCWLAPDLLHPILIVLAKGERHIPDDYEAREVEWVMPPFGQTSKWIKVIGVCKYIHTVSTSWPLLWSYVDLNHANTKWINLCAKRAGSVPLCITYDQAVSRADVTKAATSLSHSENACIALSRRCRNISAVVTVLNERIPFLRELLYAPPSFHVFDLTSQFLGGATSSLCSGIPPYLLRV